MYEPPIVTDGVEVVPGEIIAEPAPSETIISPSSPGSANPPLNAPSDLELDPLPEPSGPARAAPGTSTAPSGGAKGAGGTGLAPAGGSSPKVGLRSTASGNEQLSRTDSASGPGREAATPLSLQVLDDLPRPAEEVVASLGGGGSSGKAEGGAGEAVAATDTPPATPPPDTSAAPAVNGPSASEPAPTVVRAEPTTPAIAVEAPTFAAPGIRSFCPVDPQLAGGSFPESSGFEFLTQKGYRTILDLRDASQVRPEDLAAANHWGLRHVMLPLAVAELNADSMRRFEEELGQAGARPLFFCDTDGSRAAILWYVHRINVDKVDPALARRDAEQIGPLTSESLSRVESLVQAPRPAGAEPAATAPAPITEAPPPSDAPAKASNEPAKAEEVAAGAEAKEPVPVALEDPSAWRPYAALFLTLLVIPLAYWSGSPLVLTRRALSLASQKAGERRLRSLPPSSGA